MNCGEPFFQAVYKLFSPVQVQAVCQLPVLHLAETHASATYKHTAAVMHFTAATHHTPTTDTRSAAAELLATL
jgi:hypothetical protein